MERYIIENNRGLKTMLTFKTRDKADTYAEEKLNLKKYNVIDTKTEEIFEYEITNTGYKYRLSSTGYSSNKYGNCKCCNNHTSEVFNQTEYNWDEDSEGNGIDKGWTTYKCQNLFGCKECLIKVRR
ncbi:MULTISPECIES: hypothetical protein [unclassified Clostridium]|uniref:hypothetical protein n=1 Tax=unclassified Clostridium TaxID=2614128 RepID=UPI00207A35E8|nr:MULTISPECIES: hypothetical protein [unclassified Clostridium]